MLLPDILLASLEGPLSEIQYSTCDLQQTKLCKCYEELKEQHPKTEGES